MAETRIARITPRSEVTARSARHIGIRNQVYSIRGLMADRCSRSPSSASASSALP
jgi:hypothetical protein